MTFAAMSIKSIVSTTENDFRWLNATCTCICDGKNSDNLKKNGKCYSGNAGIEVLETQHWGQHYIVTQALQPPPPTHRHILLLLPPPPLLTKCLNSPTSPHTLCSTPHT